MASLRTSSILSKFILLDPREQLMAQALEEHLFEGEFGCGELGGVPKLLVMNSV